MLDKKRLETVAFLAEDRALAAEIRAIRLSGASSTRRSPTVHGTVLSPFLAVPRSSVRVVALISYHSLILSLFSIPAPGLKFAEALCEDLIEKTR